jgi:hypothetical protein
MVSSTKHFYPNTSGIDPVIENIILQTERPARLSKKELHYDNVQDETNYEYNFEYNMYTMLEEPHISNVYQTYLVNMRKHPKDLVLDIETDFFAYFSKNKNYYSTIPKSIRYKLHKFTLELFFTSMHLQNYKFITKSANEYIKQYERDILDFYKLIITCFKSIYAFQEYRHVVDKFIKQNISVDANYMNSFLQNNFLDFLIENLDKQYSNIYLETLSMQLKRDYNFFTNKTIYHQCLIVLYIYFKQQKSSFISDPFTFELLVSFYINMFNTLYPYKFIL